MPEAPPLGWYPDPYRRHERRYWDGAAWTEHVTSRGQQLVDAVATAPETVRVAAGWYADPSGRHEHRYWDGGGWTEHVATAGSQTVEGLPGPDGTPPPPSASVRIVSPATPPADDAGSTAVPGADLFAENLLVVDQKARVVGSSVEYSVSDRNGRRLAVVRESGRGLGARLRDSIQHRTSDDRAYTLDILDAGGERVLRLSRPQTYGKSSMLVERPDGTAVGQIVQETYGVAGAAAGLAQFGVDVVTEVLSASGLNGPADRLAGVSGDLGKVDHVRFGLESEGRRLGAIKAETAKAWGFRIEDAAGAEVAQVTKQWAGWAKERFTKADNYVVALHRPLEDPLRSLVIAAAVAIDIALKQGEQTRGSGSTRTYR